MSDRADDRDEALLTCVACGRTSPDDSEFAVVGIEDPDEEYPGYPGDYICKEGCPDVTPSLWEASNRLADLPAGTMVGGFEV